MKTRATLLALAALVTSYSVLAQEPVMGVKDPESLFKDSNPQLNRNKQAALHIERELLQCGQWDRANEWLTDAYHQHNPNAASGLKGVVYFFTQVRKQPRNENCGPLKAPVVAVIADGDYVTVMTPRVCVNLPGPNCISPNALEAIGFMAPKEGDKKPVYYTTWFDTWRFVDGKADEHWDGATK
jgi:predicted SnoaL-like aldol condensation-catalyzing enzyme